MISNLKTEERRTGWSRPAPYIKCHMMISVMTSCTCTCHNPLILVGLIGAAVVAGRSRCSSPQRLSLSLPEGHEVISSQEIESQGRMTWLHPDVSSHRHSKIFQPDAKTTTGASSPCPIAVDLLWIDLSILPSPVNKTPTPNLNSRQQVFHI